MLAISRLGKPWRREGRGYGCLAVERGLNRWVVTPSADRCRLRYRPRHLFPTYGMSAN